MTSLRDKLRSIPENQRASAAVRPPAVDCYIKNTFISLPEECFLPDGILKLMQGDQSIPNHTDTSELLFLDTETTGLSHGAGTVAFLVGVGWIQNGGIQIYQYLMRDYDEETFVLKKVLDDLNSCEVLITFNGRSFDMPLLESRFIMHRIPYDFSRVPHADILHTARRIFKLRLQSCRLSTLEEKVFFEPRTDDLLGSEVPQRYFEYLKTHDFSLLEDILKHNAQDIASLARLTFMLGRMHADPLTAGHTQDIFSLGRVFDKRGKPVEARICYRAADSGVMSGLSRQHLAASLKRSGYNEDAADIYRKMIRAHQGGTGPYIALSKLQEHQLKDINSALQTVKAGILYASDLPSSMINFDDLEDLKRRCSRLIRKLGNLTEG